MMVRPSLCLSQAQATQNQTGITSKVAGGIEKPNPLPKFHTPKEILEQMSIKRIGNPVSKTEKSRREPVAHLVTPASSLVGADLLQQQSRKNVHRMPKGDSPLRPVTPSASKRAEDILKHTRLDVGFTATDLELLADLKRETQSSLTGTRAIQSDNQAVTKAPDVKVEIQTEGDKDSTSLQEGSARPFFYSSPN